jgi:hypothetical protein
MGEKKFSYKFLVGKTEGKRSLRRPWRAWKDDIKINLKTQDGKMWNKFINLRIGCCECGNEPLFFLKCRECLEQ